MPKSENTASPKRNKKRIHLNISPEVYDKTKELGINVSEFTENALIELISNVYEMPVGKEAQIMFISAKEGNKSRFEEIRTPDLRRVKATSYH